MRVLIIVSLIAGFAVAQEGDAPKPEAPKVKKLQRGLVDGAYVDEYFGLRYEAPGLKEGFGFGDALFTGKCDGDVEVEIQLRGEAPKPMTAAEFHEKIKEHWKSDGKTRTDIEHGADPLPWTLFVEESLAGFKRHKGYGFYARGQQLFVVHAQVQEKSDTSGDAIKAALKGLELDGKNESFFMAHAVAKQNMMEPNDPRVLAGVARAYLGQQMNNPQMARKAARKALEHSDALNPDELYIANWSLGLALLTLREIEEGLPVWVRTVELSKKTTQNAAANECNARYNLTCAYSLAGKLDEAFAELKKSFEVGGEPQVADLKKHAQQDGDLENMRADPRWKELFGG